MSEFNYEPIKKEEPVVYPVDATKASLAEMGVLFNALGIAMTEEYAKTRGLDHLLILDPPKAGKKVELKMPSIK
tara:strand:+ start:3035 stop:3256 length:222 start_codon:yes stop_codon:yes gene_type:complete